MKAKKKKARDDSVKTTTFCWPLETFYAAADFLGISGASAVCMCTGADDSLRRGNAVEHRGHASFRQRWSSNF